jgi:aquaporin Z
MKLSKRAVAEFIGAFWLVCGGCGSAVLTAAFPNLGIGLLGVALAFGLTVLTMAYAYVAAQVAERSPRRECCS